MMRDGKSGHVLARNWRVYCRPLGPVSFTRGQNLRIKEKFSEWYLEATKKGKIWAMYNCRVSGGKKDHQRDHGKTPTKNGAYSRARLSSLAETDSNSKFSTKNTHLNWWEGGERTGELDAMTDPRDDDCSHGMQRIRKREIVTDLPTRADCCLYASLVRRCFEQKKKREERRILLQQPTRVNSRIHKG
jgi:hypothetical protein